MITYRNATRADSLPIAELDSIASGGIIDFMYRDLVPGKTPVELAAEAIRRESESYSFVNTVVAEVGGEIAGITISYPSGYHVLSDNMIGYFPPERIGRIRAVFTAELPESLYIDSIAVHERFRRRGIGGGLLDRAAGKAIRMGFNRLSLLTFADNEIAHCVYRRHGFRTVRQLPLEHHELIPHRGGILVMEADV